MHYRKITLEMIVFAADADAVTAELETMLDDMEERHPLFGGDIESLAVQHPEKPRRSALTHARAASETAVKATKKGLAAALRAVI